VGPLQGAEVFIWYPRVDGETVRGAVSAANRYVSAKINYGQIAAADLRVGHSAIGIGAQSYLSIYPGELVEGYSDEHSSSPKQRLKSPSHYTILRVNSYDDDVQIQSRDADWRLRLPGFATDDLLSAVSPEIEPMYCLSNANCSHAVLKVLNRGFLGWVGRQSFIDRMVAAARVSVGVGERARTYVSRTWPVLIIDQEGRRTESKAGGNYDAAYTTPGHVQARSVEIAQAMGIPRPRL
jgi:hypothetical protein